MGFPGTMPHTFQNIETEFPDATKFNANFDFLNMSSQSQIKNGSFEVFVGSLPQHWTLSGAGAVSASDVDSKHGTKAVKVTFGSATAILKQTALDFKFFQGRRVKAWCFIKTSVPNQARLKINDGVASTTGGFHTGDGTYRIIEVVHDVAMAATTLELELRVEAAGFVLFDVAALVDFHEVRSANVGIVDAVIDGGTPTFERVTITGAANAPPTANQITKETIVKAWVKFTGATGAIVDSFNVSSVVRDALGRYTVNWNTDFANADYAVSLSGLRTTDTDGMMLYLTAQSAAAISFDARIRGGQAFDPTSLYVIAIGDQ